MTKLELGTYETAAIVGAGSSGLTAIKALLREGFKSVTCFEKRDQVGGLWNYQDQNSFNQDDFKLDLIDLNTEKTKVLPHKRRLSSDHSDDDVWKYISPVYRNLETNTPRPLMELKNHPFPEGTPLFPRKDQVLQYLIDYSKDITQHIEFNSVVVNIIELKDKKKWKVVYRRVNGLTLGGSIENPLEPDLSIEVDCVIINSGNYEVPYIPSKPGLREWQAKYPSSIVHSKYYDGPEPFGDVKGEIVVVGNSASALDISLQVGNGLKKKVYKSSRSVTDVPGRDYKSIYVEKVGDIVEFFPETKTITFDDGRSLSNVDSVVFGTGFLRHYPFFQEINKGDKPFITDGIRVHGLYRQIVSFYHPGLFFTMVPRYVLPFRTAELQSSWISKVLKKKIELPDIEEMKLDELETLEKNGKGPKFH
ncbi:hypothetical protein CANARDRAFT_30436, partial [[Candida] arabinofermentans NRRL YB-2248]